LAGLIERDAKGVIDVVQSAVGGVERLVRELKLPYRHSIVGGLYSGEQYLHCAAFFCCQY
jgi:hypothetical protein